MKQELHWSWRRRSLSWMVGGFVSLGLILLGAIATPASEAQYTIQRAAFNQVSHYPWQQRPPSDRYA